MDRIEIDSLIENSLSDDEMIEVIEAVLFAAGYPVEIAKLSEILSLSTDKVKGFLSEMKNRYDNDYRGIQIVFLGNSVQLCTKEKYEPYIMQALGIKQRGKLSSASLETLAIIAYNQPVTKVIIDQIRGSDSGYSISVLLEKNLIDISGKLDVPGRPNLYSTTKDFLRVFGISDLSELPKLSDNEEQQLRIEGI